MPEHQQNLLDKQHALLVHVDFPDTSSFEHLAELKDLAISAGLMVVGAVTIKRDKPDAKYFIGSGKLDELLLLKKTSDAEIVLFNHALSPAQERNLSKYLECPVLDRTQLILEIFAARARTFEGKLQVELAQLEHLSTRLVRGWTHLERQRGGIGLRGGPGETQLEIDRRIIGDRIHLIKKRLEKIEKQRHLQRRTRIKIPLPTISLVGYTNAGKSTLFNALTSASVFIADQLFATLDPTLRRLTIKPIGAVVLADTVGFIRDLPHELVAAFRATLEESRQASLLLHVVDAHLDTLDETMHAVNVVLDEIKAATVPQLLVYNKIDLLDAAEPHIDFDENGKPYRVWVSAQTGLGFDLLFEAIISLLSDQFIHCGILLHPHESKLRAMFYELGAVRDETFTDEGMMQMELFIRGADFQKCVLIAP